jgi:DNA-directed RNA polymerase specialized sigma24 family protein
MTTTTEVPWSLEPRVTPTAIAALVTQVLAHEDGAWQDLWRAIEPPLHAMLRRPTFLGRLSDSEEHRRNILVDIMAGLRADDYARLRSFDAARRKSPGLPFFAWLAVVAKRLAIDYMRRQDEYVDLRRRADDGPKGAWHAMTSLPSESRLPGARPPVTNEGTARELIAWAESGGLATLQAEALALWTEGERFQAIARTLGLRTAAEAERLVRSALAGMRRRFRDEETP